jgi:circadian clock protein KaiB
MYFYQLINFLFNISEVRVPEKPEKTENQTGRAGKKKNGQDYILKLYVAGMTPRSAIAIAQIKHICEEYLPNKYDLEIIDIFRSPVLAKGEQIIAAPTLIKKLPLPLRKLIGDMSDREKVILGLDLKQKVRI